MNADLLLALIAFAFVTSITPGPNNIMLMTSGANFGFRRTIPHMAGVALGFVFLASAVGLGLVGLFDAWPASHAVLKAASLGYLLWLAWKFANAAPPEGRATTGRPMTFLQAAAFQWVNPKAWAMALTAVTAYAPGHGPAAVLTVAAVFGAVNLPSVGTWVVAGQAMRRLLDTPSRLRAFNWTMAVLLVASALPVVLAG
jgi:threonine/homoserine/homoserine lactone efflux protein